MNDSMAVRFVIFWRVFWVVFGAVVTCYYLPLRYLWYTDNIFSSEKRTFKEDWELWSS